MYSGYIHTFAHAVNQALRMQNVVVVGAVRSIASDDTDSTPVEEEDRHRRSAEGRDTASRRTRRNKSDGNR